MKCITIGMVCFLLGLSPHIANAQNLVPNASFEEADTCREFLGFYETSDGPLNWFSASGSPDYYQGCLPYGTANGVPQSFYAYQQSQDGESHIGMVTYQLPEGLREYVMVELSSPLVEGQTYYASVYANAGWNGSLQNPGLYIASSHVGMLFTMQPRPWSIGDPWPLAGNFAQVYHPEIVADTVAWTLISGSFVADSAYQYLMIGNHFDNVITDTLHFATFQWLPKAYTLIDNVCVSTNPLGCPLATGIANSGAFPISLYPNPAMDEVVVRGLTEDASASIYDALGRKVWQGRLTRQYSTLDVHDMPRGSFILRLEEKEQSRSFKFVLIE